MINSRVKSINTFHLAIGWPITWFTAVQQSNAVNGVVRRFSYSSAPKSLETTVCYLSHTFLWEASPWLDSILDLALFEECAFESEWRYIGLVWWVVQHLTYGGRSGWAAWTRWHPPDVCGYDWEWLIENRQEFWTSRFQSILLAKVVTFNLALAPFSSFMSRNDWIIRSLKQSLH